MEIRRALRSSCWLLPLLLAAACGDDTPPPPACTPGVTLPCYDGPLGTLGNGRCLAGAHTCLPDGSGFDACVGAVLPAERDSCLEPATDDDCSGQAGDSCPCQPGANVPCGAGLPGPCQQGVMTCLPDGSGYGECTGEIVPMPEDCANDIDDDCDGTVNDGCP